LLPDGVVDLYGSRHVLTTKSIPMPSARGREAKPSISSAIWATPALASRALRNAKPSGAEEGYRKATRPLATIDTVCRKLKTFKAPSSFGRTE
jgi:hypothetical protein